MLSRCAPSGAWPIDTSAGVICAAGDGCGLPGLAVAVAATVGGCASVEAASTGVWTADAVGVVSASCVVVGWRIVDVASACGASAGDVAGRGGSGGATAMFAGASVASLSAAAVASGCDAGMASDGIVAGGGATAMVGPGGIASVIVAALLLSSSRRLAAVGRCRPITALVSGAVATGIAATGGGSCIAAPRSEPGVAGCSADGGPSARAAGSDVAAPVEAVSGATSGCAGADANASTDISFAFAVMDGGSPVAGASIVSAVPFGTIAAINRIS